VILQSGPRLLDMTLEMRSLNHQLVFDRLYLSNFGSAGDPNNVSRLRVGKNKWYDFLIRQCPGRVQSHHQRFAASFNTRRRMRLQPHAAAGIEDTFPAGLLPQCE
jgi:hypothetical protein